jgi:hypothetical protein
MLIFYIHKTYLNWFLLNFPDCRKYLFKTIFDYLDRIGGVMASILASSAVDRGFEPRSDQTKDYKIGSCCFSANHAALRSKSKDGLAQNHNNMYEWSDMSALLFH